MVFSATCKFKRQAKTTMHSFVFYRRVQRKVRNLYADNAENVNIFKCKLLKETAKKSV